jgi:hypothetical protein
LVPEQTKTYIDEAVVEEEAEDGRAHACLLLHGLRHAPTHDGRQRRARRVVERRRQLPFDDTTTTTAAAAAVIATARSNALVIPVA